jgi:hypothetical protein
VLAAAVDARFAILFGGGMVAATALLFLTSERLRRIGSDQFGFGEVERT